MSDLRRNSEKRALLTGDLRKFSVKNPCCIKIPFSIPLYLPGTFLSYLQVQIYSSSSEKLFTNSIHLG